MRHKHAGNGLRMIWIASLNNTWNGVGFGQGWKESRRSQNAWSICVPLSQLFSIIDFHSLLPFHRQAIWRCKHVGLCQWFPLILKLMPHGVDFGVCLREEITCSIITMGCFVVEPRVLQPLSGN